MTPAGARLFFSDSGISAASGGAVRFERDAAGRLTAVVGPDGTAVVYRHDAAGRLVLARNQVTGAAHRYGYDNAGHLALILSPAGEPSLAVTYGVVPQSIPVKVDLGSAHQFASATTAERLAISTCLPLTRNSAEIDSTKTAPQT